VIFLEVITRKFVPHRSHKGPLYYFILINEKWVKQKQKFDHLLFFPPKLSQFQHIVVRKMDCGTIRGIFVNPPRNHRKAQK
jgi:hypothetical protein